MKTHRLATRIAVALGLTTLGLALPPTTARAGLFHKRTVVVETPAVFVAPVPTAYASPVTAVVAAPAVPTTIVEPVVPTTYVPTVSTTVVGAPAVTTYVPTVTTTPMILVPATRVRVARPRRTYLNGY